MTMRIQIGYGDEFVSFHFARESGEDQTRWGILVIDDFWDAVREMAIGTDDAKGLGEKSVQYDNVAAYWDVLEPSEYVFERALLLMPWMLCDEWTCASISFVPFPSNVDQLRASIYTLSVGLISRCAVLIDITDEGNARKIAFPDTWALLDECGHPRFARAKFSRGGVLLDRKFDSVPIIGKQAPQGGDEAHKMQLLQWFKGVQGQISPTLFDDATGKRLSNEVAMDVDRCHNPTDLRDASSARRKSVCRSLTASDQYGVWRWASELALQDPLPANAPYRWLAAKAFQTTNSFGDYSGEVPLTAVIAICEGVSKLEPERLRDYIVISPLCDIEDRNINALSALGGVTLASGSYGHFAPVLRDWLTHPEHFSHSNDVRTCELRTRGNQEVDLIFSYGRELPERIFDPNAPRHGTIGMLWNRLRSFAKSYSHYGPIITLTFAYTSN